ncbi:hypothetical protein V6N13_017436 [Hibiscus sabdariffa]|uniref:Uncharacterized protein n=1 Tax=Hibiscus sabdariffa TaxID=183260 RepID=A0ABR2CZR7_9ROSI
MTSALGSDGGIPHTTTRFMSRQQSTASYPSNHKPRHPIVDFGFHKSSVEKHVRDAPRAQMMESEYYGYPQFVKRTENFQVEEDVDQEAGDFIASEHKKFVRSRTTSG